MIKVISCFSVLVASVAIACGGGDDIRVQASRYAVDPIPCAQDSDCCVVNDGCKASAYVVAAGDSSKVSSLLASADNTVCERCVTPMIQLKCLVGRCVGQRITPGCPLPTDYPGDHCGVLDVPSSCLPIAPSGDAGSDAGSSDAGSDVRSNVAGSNAFERTTKPLAVFKCGG
jgi:hypothetical protein